MPRTRTSLLSLPLVLLTLAWGCASGGSAPDGAGDATAPAPAAASPAAAPASDALFTAAQAERGKAVYDNVCLECHTRVEFAENAFLFAWEGASVGRLFSYMQESMPDDAPGSLPERDYLAVTAYILELNGWAPGDAEMANDPDRLRAVRFEARGGETP